MSHHRAETSRRHVQVVAPKKPGGRRKAVKQQSTLRRSVTEVPMLPTVAGVLAIGAAVGGAVSVSAADAHAAMMSTPRSTSAPVFGDFETLGIDSSLDQRQHAISRDAARTTSQASADQKLRSDVERLARKRTKALRNLALASEAQGKHLKELKAWVLPTTGYRLTGRFGQSSGLWSSTHTGLDFATDSGTPIVAVASGLITETGWSGSYGYRTVETLPDGTELWYAHQLTIEVNPGQVVRSGQQIGEVGSTGNSTGSHVHLEVRPGGGDPIDPYTALVYHGLQP